MPKIIRKDIALETSPWSDSIVWYAVGVNAMMQRPITDPASWWYFAAIHGEDIAGTDQGMPGWQNLVPPLTPPAIVWGTFKSGDPYPVMWDQCQHATWFFPPWHRGYLIALESQLQADIAAAGGPTNWALPYWNYWNSNGNLPVEFTQKTLPGSTGSGAAFPANLGGLPNPLYVTMRYGSADLSNISASCLSDGVYTGALGAGFGGGSTPFIHFGSSTGDLENNPHNIVQGDVGGQSANPPGYYGWMADPEYAALDPIFYLHHGMIDALWAFWNTGTANKNPSSAKWLNPAFPNHPGMFLMPWEPAGSGITWQYKPQDVTNLGTLQITLSNGQSVPYTYTYDFLDNPGQATSPFNQALQAPSSTTRLLRLGAPQTLVAATTIESAEHPTELLGASVGSVPISNDGALVPLKLDPTTRTKLVSSFAKILSARSPDRVFLQLEGVTGTSGASALDVFINVPGQAKQKVGTAGLFALRQASTPNAAHGGSGLSFGFDITQIVDGLHLASGLESGNLHVNVAPHRPIPSGKTIQIGRISVHRQAQ